MGTVGDIRDIVVIGGLGVGAYLVYKFYNRYFTAKGIDESLSETPIIGGTYGIIPKWIEQAKNIRWADVSPGGLAGGNNYE